LEREHREAEVLVRIAPGKGNYDIGVILGAQTRIIYKHVENRTAAAAVFFAISSQLF